MSKSQPVLVALKALVGECTDLIERYDEEDVVGIPFRLALQDAIRAIAQTAIEKEAQS